MNIIYEDTNIIILQINKNEINTDMFKRFINSRYGKFGKNNNSQSLIKI